jgi:signal transduction histidine kinase
VFEPFFTTKPVGKGTGLGGSISYGIVHDMQGEIWAENTEAGARFNIKLPTRSRVIDASSKNSDLGAVGSVSEGLSK